ncbi:hypothetical protein RvY_13029 [Ramazzottius varieornatus]|uniref:Evolutionarily conserved signaling intermediate in Toll pathway, mitochondrial n=1 Tax=Ramazzottius varieornatus TaxID=947166 RepID=A0A1D1VNQ8_RAMVA|nr:hypothetical protein RvY_13029 [Ramazzottius varieornatus]
MCSKWKHVGSIRKELISCLDHRSRPQLNAHPGIAGLSSQLARHYATAAKPPRTDSFRRKKPSDLMLQQAAEVEQKTMYFDEIKHDLRNKNAFRGAIASFLKRDIRRAGHVEFIYAALKRLKHFGVEKDLDVYKDILNVFPKGRFVAQNMWQVEFMHYPRQQDCCIDVLCEMEKYGVIGDTEMYHIILNVFGDRSYAMRKFKRMMYWYPKFRYANPYPIPWPTPKDPYEQARLALERMCPDLKKKVTVVQAHEVDEHAEDPTWIASLICPDQIVLIAKHPDDRPLYVEGEFSVHLREAWLKYFILRDEPKEMLDAGPLVNPKSYYEADTSTDWDLFFQNETSKEFAPLSSVHEQEDGNILSICITGSGSKLSLKSWIAYLTRTNPRLAQVPIVFRIRTISTDNELLVSDDNLRTAEVA